MTSILVVEHEGRYIERIQDALASEGWSPRFVAGRPEALRAAASEAPSLVLVNAELPGAPELLGTFARRNGGPGVIALIAERGDSEQAGGAADEVLAKPFTDQQLRLIVRRGLAAAAGGGRSGPGPARPTVPDGAGERKLTSAEIFGDVLAEIESEISGGEPRPAAAPPEPPGTHGPSARQAGPPPPPGAAPPAAPESAPAASATPPADRHRPYADDEEIDRKLEKTLSGVFGDDRPRRRSGSPADRRPPKSVKPPQDDDVEELLNMTLSSLDLGLALRRTAPSPPGGRAPAPPPTAEDESPFGDLDLSELEALADTGRRKAPAAAGDRSAAAAPAPPRPTLVPPPVVPAPPPAEPGPAAAEPAAAPDEPAEPPVAPAVPRDAEPAVTASAVAPDEPEGRRFGHYTLLERIAAGGMAEVWKARMRGVEGFQKTVAIKKILPHMTHDPDFVGMFIDEAKLAAQLNHPNIIHIYDLGKLGDDFYIAMEYVDGRNLRALLDQARAKGEPLPVGLALLVGARLASGLDYAHRKRDFDGADLELVHRDVSPQNVLLSSDGDIKLCDFGISKAVAKVSRTQSGALKGKLQYMSPEQAWGRPVDSRSDVFSLGVLLFEMLTGERLFTGDSEISVLEAVRECHVRSPREIRPEIPEEVETVVLRALAADPAERFQAAGELQKELERALHRLHPAPTPADLAAYLRRLDATPPADGDAAPAGATPADGPSTGGPSRPGTGSPAGEGIPPGAVAAAPGTRTGGRDLTGSPDGGPAPAAGASAWTGSFVPRSEAPEGEPRDAGARPPEPEDAARPPRAGEASQPAEPAGAGAGPALSAPAAGTEIPAPLPEAAVPLAPAGDEEVELEEGGRRRRWLLLAAIALVLAAAAVFWLIYGSALTPGGQGPPPPAVGGEAPSGVAAPPVGEATPDEPAAGPGADGGEAPQTAAPDFEDLVSREMARKEEELRRQVEAEYREEQRRLEEQLARARAEAARRPSEPPPETAGPESRDDGGAQTGGDGGPGGAPPPSGGASPARPPGTEGDGAAAAPSLSASTNPHILPSPSAHRVAAPSPRRSLPAAPRDDPARAGDP